MINIIYLVAVIIFILGLYIMLASDHYLRKLLGLGIFQSATLIFYISISKLRDGIVPIDICNRANVGAEVEVNNMLVSNCAYQFTNPLSHVLMLTAIVVGFATLSVGLALIYRIKKEFGTVSEKKINELMVNDDVY